MSEKFSEYPQYETEEITPLYNNLEEAYDGGYQQGRKSVIEEILSTRYFNDKIKLIDMEPYVNLQTFVEWIEKLEVQQD